MPPLIRRYIKTSFVCLLAGLALGGYISVSQFVVGRHPPSLFVTAHVHLLLVGFVLMLIVGVATWMFPRPARDDERAASGSSPRPRCSWSTCGGTCACRRRRLGEDPDPDHASSHTVLRSFGSCESTSSASPGESWSFSAPKIAWVTLRASTRLVSLASPRTRS